MRKCQDCGNETDLNPFCIYCEESYERSNRIAKENFLKRTEYLQIFLKLLDQIAPAHILWEVYE